jgi:hypothetical protein
MMDRGTVRNMYSFIPKIKFEKLLRLVGFVIRIYHDARSPERQICSIPPVNLYYIYHCCMYSEKLLMMGRGTVRNM